MFLFLLSSDFFHYESTVLNQDQDRHFDGPGLEVINFDYSLRLKIKRNDWLLADMCPQAANHSALF